MLIADKVVPLAFWVFSGWTHAVYFKSYRSDRNSENAPYFLDPQINNSKNAGEIISVLL